MLGLPSPNPPVLGIGVKSSTDMKPTPRGRPFCDGTVPGAPDVASALKNSAPSVARPASTAGSSRLIRPKADEKPPSCWSDAPDDFIRRPHVGEVTDLFGNVVRTFYLPRTKKGGANGARGETTQCARQPGLLDPFASLDRHIELNAPGPNEHLFSWSHPSLGRRPLSKAEVAKRLKTALANRTFEGPPPKGHSLRIGGTLFYLLRNVPFEVVKTQGRWSSDAFQGYLREHAMVLAPYLQDHPDIFRRFNNHIIELPPVR